jgi:predicted transcriptional regulator
MGMDDLIKHKVLYLLMQGWKNLTSIAEALDTDVDEVLKALKDLEIDGNITTHTIH